MMPKWSPRVPKWSPRDLQIEVLTSQRSVPALREIRIQLLLDGIKEVTVDRKGGKASIAIPEDFPQTVLRVGAKELFMEEIVAMAAEFGVDTTNASDMISAFSPGGVFGMSQVHGPAVPTNVPKITWKEAAGRMEGGDGYVSGDYLRLWSRQRGGKSVSGTDPYIAIEKDNGELKQSELHVG